ncbi:large-conductance mechanosensitive channel [Geomicrobium sp. JCM 19037]|uniref:large-conductance mechanosensitive channel protein MscL n=1 Tax=unclassified Geomicrobium TaxID=2628951 RepID=UPI00045F2210|nr:large-conductance mechanosensitive channel protein MscL [Geomicrobium sp. JCM 19037]GAK02698.1 large-conductance mechanosensitive channel [Geomicrobium sp. JCM 19037]
MWKEFKAFIAQGNVIDLAVAVVIGTAFQQIVSALVDNIIMPLVGVILGGVDFSTLVIGVGEAQVEYGLFIQAIVDFFIIAMAIFIFVKVATKLMKKRANEEEEPAPEEPTATELYLKEIRDLLHAEQEEKQTSTKDENVEPASSEDHEIETAEEQPKDER